MDLKSYLEKEDITNMEFAEMIDVHHNTISNWLNRHFRPCPEMINRIEFATDGEVTFKDLMAYWEAKKKDG